MPDEFNAERYVRHTAALLGLTLDDDAASGAAKHLAIARNLADLIMDEPLSPTDEPAPRFEP